MERALQKVRELLRTLPDSGLLTKIAPGGDFLIASLQETTFFQAITLGSLNAFPDLSTERIRVKLENNLRQYRRVLGSWNYWSPGASAMVQRPLPDDLDTTCCALSALAETAAGLPGEWLADAVKILTLREVTAGGPYRTWLVPTEAKDAWQDVDIVVNANVGRFLSHFDTSPPPLISFLDQAVSDSSCTSPYYPDRLLFCYFLASWYKGERRDLLASQCRAALRRAVNIPGTQTLALALATAGWFTEIPTAELDVAAKELARRCQEQPIVAEGACIDAVHGEVKDYAGCQAFTLAVCQEALARTLQRQSLPIKNPGLEFEQKIVQRAKEALQTYREPLKAALGQTLTRHLLADTQHNLTLFPFVIAEAVSGLPVDTEVNLDLAQAHLFGWLAYTTFDDIVDGDSPASDLWLGNVFQRLSAQLFNEAFSHQADWLSWHQDVLDRMAAMNLAEQRSWRIVDGKLPETMPNADLAYLTERSLGVLLAPVALLKRVASSDTRPVQIAAAKEFLLNLIAARQLCDDAHDWQEDLKQGRLNSASALIFAKHDIALTDVAGQQRRFWASVIDTIAAQVNVHCAAARVAANGFAGDLTAVEKLLATLEKSLAKAVRERNLAQDFLNAYTQPTSPI